MKTTLKSIAILFASLLFAYTAKSQNLLSPNEIFKTHQLKDTVSILSLISAKGYTHGYSWGDANERVSNWSFQTRPGEYADFTLTKIVSSGKTKTVYFISNTFHYKQFMELAIQQSFKFTGVEIINNDAYFTFRNGNNYFYTKQGCVMINQ